MLRISLVEYGNGGGRRHLKSFAEIAEKVEII
jgi:hypothetical protein